MWFEGVQHFSHLCFHHRCSRETVHFHQENDFCCTLWKNLTSRSYRVYVRYVHFTYVHAGRSDVMLVGVGVTRLLNPIAIIVSLFELPIRRKSSHGFQGLNVLKQYIQIHVLQSSIALAKQWAFDKAVGFSMLDRWKEWCHSSYFFNWTIINHSFIRLNQSGMSIFDSCGNKLTERQHITKVGGVCLVSKFWATGPLESNGWVERHTHHGHAMCYPRHSLQWF